MQRQCACGKHAPGGGECAGCRKKRMGLQRQASPRAAGPHLSAAALPRSPNPLAGEGKSLVHDVLRAPGRPLDAAARAYMEPRFGREFSRVRLHTGPRAAESARAVGALAYTVGQDVVFGAGQYAPATRAGRQLLAHELTHTLQQGPGAASPPQDLRVGPPDSAEERLAEANGGAAAGGGPLRAAGASGMPEPAVQRQPAPIESERSESTDLQVNLQEIRASLDLLRGRHRFLGQARLLSPAGAALDLLRVPHPLDPPRLEGILRYDSRCNAALQSALVSLEANPFVSVGQVPWQINTRVGVRVGSLRFEPGVGVSFAGDQFDRLLFTLNLAAASTAIPPECIAPPPTTTPPRRTPGPPAEPPRGEELPPPSTTPARLPAYTLHFFYDSTLMRPEDHDTFQRVIDLLQMVPSLHIQLTGHASLEGTDPYNQRLSEQRAAAVGDRLALAGIAASRIRTQGVGETAPAVREPAIPRRSLDPNVERVRTLNRRVEVTFFDPAGRFEPSLRLPERESPFSLGVPRLRLGE